MSFLELAGSFRRSSLRCVDRDALDEAGLERLIEHVLGGGVHGLFILGTTGEAPSLSYRLRRELISRVCELVSGRVPVLVGITDTAFVESVGLGAARGRRRRERRSCFRRRTTFPPVKPN